jgi:LacI family transcriptional regulator
MAHKRVTLAEIAGRLGVSTITVSRALKGQPGIGEGLRKEIRDLAAELGYQYERLHQGKDRKGRFVFIVPKRFFLAIDTFYHDIYYHLNALCMTAGRELAVAILEKDAELQGALPEGLSLAEGIFIGGEIADCALQAVVALGVPCVAVDFNVINGSVSCVTIDNYMVGVAAAEYLYKRGYRKIGFIGSFGRTTSATDRIHGFLRMVRQNELYFRDDWIIDNYDITTETYVMDRPLPDEMPEALISYNDRTSYYFIERLKNAGYRVPGDVAILSIDNTSLAASCTPALTCINISRRRFAGEALRLMMERLKGNTAVQRVYLNIDIVERDSVPAKGR